MVSSNKYSPLRENLQQLDEDDRLPPKYYAFGFIMAVLVIALPLLYRHLWLYLFELIGDLSHTICLPNPPDGCRQYGKLAYKNLSKTRSTYKSSTNQTHKDFPSHTNGQLDDIPHSDLKNSELKGKIEALYVHPIKSCHAVEIEEATITAGGLQYDRMFVFAQRTTSIPDPTTGKVAELWNFLTQRSHPKLQLIKSDIWIPDPATADYDEDSEWIKNGGCLVVRFPYLDDLEFSYTGFKNYLRLMLARLQSRSWSALPLTEFRLPIRPTAERAKAMNYQTERMRIWSEAPESWNLTSEIPADTLRKLAFFIGVSNPLTIFAVAPGKQRLVYKNAPTEATLGYQPNVQFQDGYPLHIQNLASIHAVEDGILNPSSTPFDLTYKPDSRRFRANIYVNGPTAFVEAYVIRMAIQPRRDFQSSDNTQPLEPITLSLPSRCPRCTLPTNDPSTGTRSKTLFPLKYLRKNTNIDKGTKGTPVLGMNAVPFGEAIGQTIRKGDDCIFYKLGEHEYNPHGEKEKQTPIE